MDLMKRNNYAINYNNNNNIVTCPLAKSYVTGPLTRQVLQRSLRHLANSVPIREERSPQPQAMRGSFGAGETLQRCLVT